jgi:hypothetical protein
MESLVLPKFSEAYSGVNAMKNLILNGFSFLLISATITPVLSAEIAVVNPTTNSTANRSQINPFNLVHLAYRGYFRDQGIPGYNAFLSAFDTGKISAKDVVQSAIKKNKRSSQVLGDRGYLRSFEAQVESLRRD